VEKLPVSQVDADMPHLPAGLEEDQVSGPQGTLSDIPPD
jgi:hypothetical protein